MLDNILATLEVQFLYCRFLELCCKEAEKMDEEATDRRRVNSLRAELAALDRDIDRARGRLAKVEDEEFEFLNGQLTGWKARRRTSRPNSVRPTPRPTGGGRRNFFADLRRRFGGCAAVKRKYPEAVRANIRRIIGSVRLGVERRLVGKVKHRYFLVGGDVVMQTGPTARLRARVGTCGGAGVVTLPSSTSRQAAWEVRGGKERRPGQLLTCLHVNPNLSPGNGQVGMMVGSFRQEADGVDQQKGRLPSLCVVLPA